MLPIAPPALADDEGSSGSSCSYSSLESLPTALKRVSSKASGDPKVAEAVLLEDPLLANPSRLSAAVDACAADDSAKKDFMKKYNVLLEEFKYQTSKTYDPRWADPEDVADLDQKIRQFSTAVSRYLTSVPEAQRA